jgi:hypothetical protein
MKILCYTYLDKNCFSKIIEYKIKKTTLFSFISSHATHVGKSKYRGFSSYRVINPTDQHFSLGIPSTEEILGVLHGGPQTFFQGVETSKHAIYQKQFTICKTTSSPVDPHANCQIITYPIFLTNFHRFNVLSVTLRTTEFK